MQLCPVSEGVSAFVVYSGRAGPSESAQFQGLPGAILSSSSSFLQELPAGWNVSISERIVTEQDPRAP